MHGNRVRLLILAALCGAIGTAVWRWADDGPSAPSALSHADRDDDVDSTELPQRPRLLEAEWPRNAPAYFDPDLIDPEIYEGTVHADGLIITRPRDPAIPGSAERTPPATLQSPAHALPIDARTAEAARELSELVDRELADLSEEERRVWLGVLQGMPAKEAEEILQIWKLTGGVEKFTRSATGFESPTLSGDEASPVGAPPAAASGGSPGDAELTRVLMDNLRHADTPGYLRSEVAAQGRTRLDLTPGESRSTGNPFDLAIDGTGFFLLQQGERTALTRCGRFDVSEQGELIQDRPDGEWRLIPPVRLPPDAAQLVVAPNGQVSIVTGDQQIVVAGQIRLATCFNPQHLERLSGDLLRAGPRSGSVHQRGPGSGVGSLRQGALQMSNVDRERESAALERHQRHKDVHRGAPRLSHGDRSAGMVEPAVVR